MALFSDPDRIFIAAHMKGCTLDELKSYLQISRATMYRYEKEGKIHKMVAFAAMIRLIDLCHNFVLVSVVSRHHRADYDLVSELTLADFFGEYRTNLSGWLVIRKEWLDKKTFQSVYRPAELSRQDRYHRHGSVRCLTAWARATQTKRWRWFKWFKEGYLRGRQERRINWVTLKEVKRFLKAAAAGAYPTVDAAQVAGLLDLLEKGGR